MNSRTSKVESRRQDGAAPRGIVARFNPDGVLKPHQYLCRRDELLAEEEWYWATSREEAFEFPTHEEADARARVEHGWALVVGVESRTSKVEGRRREERRVSPEEAYAELERRHLD